MLAATVQVCYSCHVLPGPLWWSGPSPVHLSSLKLHFARWFVTNARGCHCSPHSFLGKRWGSTWWTVSSLGDGQLAPSYFLQFAVLEIQGKPMITGSNRSTVSSHHDGLHLQAKQPLSFLSLFCWLFCHSRTRANIDTIASHQLPWVYSKSHFWKTTSVTWLTCRNSVPLHPLCLAWVEKL